MDTERFAPDGKIWVCGACGKTARDLYGLEGQNHSGWDESCMLNSVLCNEADLTISGDRVVNTRLIVDRFGVPLEPTTGTWPATT